MKKKALEKLADEAINGKASKTAIEPATVVADFSVSEND